MSVITNQKSFSLLGHTRALYSCAKIRKKWHWKFEIAATIFAVLASFIPIWQASATLVILSLGSKVLAKFFSSEAKSFFRRAERFRRYDFEERTLGWPLPPKERADINISNSEIQSLASKWSKRDSDYYTTEGPPNTKRLFSNLLESIFWSQALMGKMANRRWKQFYLALMVAVITFFALAIIQPGEAAVFVIKSFATVVSLLVALDIYGEARSFQRGEKELSQILTALTVVGQVNAINNNEVMRFFVEYNCILSELPMIPDEIYTKATPELNSGWDSYQTGILILNEGHI